MAAKIRQNRVALSGWDTANVTVAVSQISAMADIVSFSAIAPVPSELAAAIAADKTQDGGATLHCQR